jgi:hypothetical protein
MELWSDLNNFENRIANFTHPKACKTHPFGDLWSLFGFCSQFPQILEIGKVHEQLRGLGNSGLVLWALNGGVLKTAFGTY